VGDEPCVTYIGPGAAGHFVKMVHNGIEYGLMQLIAETYAVLKTGLGMDNAAIGQVFTQWNAGRLQSFLLDITKDIFAFIAPNTDHLLLDDIKDEARSKGTGKWTSQVAMDLELPIPTIDTAVAMRDLSKYKALREQLAGLYGPAAGALPVEKEAFLAQLEQAFYFSMAITYAQGMQLLTKASKDFSYDLKLDEIAKIWRGGCIIRSGFLTEIFNAYQKAPDLAHLLLDEQVRDVVSAAAPGSRAVVAAAVTAGLALPGYSSALSYFDTFRTARMPSNLIQAQRDYFGAHTYELIGKEGVFHTQWTPEHEDAANKKDVEVGQEVKTEKPVTPNS
jgi:6-phosphogluconate dehydrogenase